MMKQWIETEDGELLNLRYVVRIAWRGHQVEADLVYGDTSESVVIDSAGKGPDDPDFSKRWDVLGKNWESLKEALEL